MLFSKKIFILIDLREDETIEIKQWFARSCIVHIYTKIDLICTGWLPYKGDIRTGYCFARHIPLHDDLSTKSVFRSTWSCSPFLLSCLSSILTIYFSKQTFSSHILQDPKLSLGRKLLYKMFHDPLFSTFPQHYEMLPLNANTD